MTATEVGGLQEERGDGGGRTTGREGRRRWEDYRKRGVTEVGGLQEGRCDGGGRTTGREV